MDRAWNNGLDSIVARWTTAEGYATVMAKDRRRRRSLLRPKVRSSNGGEKLVISKENKVKRIKWWIELYNPEPTSLGYKIAYFHEVLDRYRIIHKKEEEEKGMCMCLRKNVHVHSNLATNLSVCMYTQHLAIRTEEQQIQTCKIQKKEFS